MDGRYRRIARHCSPLRLGLILVTWFAFVLDVVPLVLTKGVAADLRYMPGQAVSSSMLGVTCSAPSWRRSSPWCSAG
jgi:hypothetical protein